MMSIDTGPTTTGHRMRAGSPERASRWRRGLAALAVAALGFTGVGMLGLAPAAAEDAPAATCIEPQVLDTDGTTCVDPTPAEENAPAEETAPPTTCTEPQVLDTDGVTCIDPAPAEMPTATLKVDEVVAQAPQGKIAFCHRTASNTNPYVPIETNLNAFYNAGHIDHTGPVWPAVGPDGKWGDIYPPNVYDADGQNWGPDAQAFVDNGCSSEESLTPGIAIDAQSCTYYDGYGWAEIAATNTDSDYFYELLLDGVVVDSGWGDEEIAYFSYLDPDTYTVTVRMYDSDEEGDLVTESSTEFTLEPCPELGITATPSTCSTGSNGSAQVLVTGLLTDESLYQEYEWGYTGPNGAYGGGAIVPTGPSYEFTISGLAPGDYTVTVYWNAVPATSEKAIVAEEQHLTVSTTFTIAACPALANTGVGDIAGPVNLALLLTILGGTAMAIAYQRRENAALRTPFLG